MLRLLITVAVDWWDGNCDNYALSILAIGLGVGISVALAMHRGIIFRHSPMYVGKGEEGQTAGGERREQLATTYRLEETAKLYHRERSIWS